MKRAWIVSGVKPKESQYTESFNRRRRFSFPNINWSLIRSAKSSLKRILLKVTRVATWCPLRKSFNKVKLLMPGFTAYRPVRMDAGYFNNPLNCLKLPIRRQFAESLNCRQRSSKSFLSYLVLYRKFLYLLMLRAYLQQLFFLLLALLLLYHSCNWFSWHFHLIHFQDKLHFLIFL